MSPQERSLLQDFLQDLGRTRGGLKDAEASGLIDQAIRANPDAAYLLVQHAILADQALHAAKAQIAELQSRQGGAGAQGSFLGGNGGAAAGGPWGRSYDPPPATVQPPLQSQPRPGLFGAGPAQPGGFGSFLRSAGTTAAGVAGGAFLFDGLANLFGGHHGFGGGLGGMGGGWGGGYGGPEVENVTVNEYGDQPYDNGAGGGSGFDDGGGYGGDDGGYDDGGVT